MEKRRCTCQVLWFSVQKLIAFLINNQCFGSVMPDPLSIALWIRIRIPDPKFFKLLKIFIFPHIILNYKRALEKL